MTPSAFLHGLELEEHLPLFEANGIDTEALLALTDADLKELGVARLGDRNKILAALEKMRCPAPGAAQGKPLRTRPLPCATPTPHGLSPGPRRSPSPCGSISS